MRSTRTSTTTPIRPGCRCCARRSPTSLAADFGLRYNADEIIVTAGVQESIMLCMLGLVNPGDEVLITSPRFTTYDMAVHMCGGRAGAGAHLRRGRLRAHARRH